jgi:hypothetical protein
MPDAAKLRVRSKTCKETKEITMFVSPFVAALLIGSFWTGVGATAVVNNSDMFNHHRSDVVITASTTDHDQACAARYRSYNPDTGQYLSSRDYKWHDCAL